MGHLGVRRQHVASGFPPELVEILLLVPGMADDLNAPGMESGDPPRPVVALFAEVDDRDVERSLVSGRRLVSKRLERTLEPDGPHKVGFEDQDAHARLLPPDSFGYTAAMTAALLALVLVAQEPAASFGPTGPQLRVTMARGGSFVITTDKAGSPGTVAHIVKLVRNGFYDRQRVHRVEPWVTQWGAPASKTKPMTDEDVLGGGSGKDIAFEESKWDFHRGVVGIASVGLQRGGDSQIFILKKDTFRLYRSYAVLGKVTSGMNVVDRIKKGDRIASIRVIR